LLDAQRLVVAKAAFPDTPEYLYCGSYKEGHKMDIEFKRLSEVNPADIVDLMNNPLVRRQMPLIRPFDAEKCTVFIEAKEQLWLEHGYGPWAFIIDGEFAGWGGLQPESGEADLALVLHPNYWGTGQTLYNEIIKRAFGEMGFESVTILFPPSRTRVKGILRLGFKPDGEVDISGERFIRYRLSAPSAGG
jgi:RimJ/RimL family protein N-acetyltransferase